MATNDTSYIQDQTKIEALVLGNIAIEVERMDSSEGQAQIEPIMLRHSGP